MSEADKMLIEDLLWQVEKHHTIISSVLLPEPQITRNRLHLKITAHHVREILKIEPFHLSDEEFGDSLCQLQHLRKAPLYFLEKYSMVPYQIMQLNPVKSESFSSYSISEINESNCLNAEIEESTASKDSARLQTKVVPDIYKQDKANTSTTMTTTMCGTSQVQKTPTQHYGEHLECDQETSNPINSSVRKLNCEHQTKIIAKAHDAQKTLPEDLNPLADFILLRSKQPTVTSPMVEVQSSNSNNVNVESKVENYPIQMTENNVSIEHLYIQADQQRTSTVVEVQASESQCRGYCMLHDVAVSVQTQLKNIGTDYNWMGNFAMLSFDKTRWFLKQHEKKVNNNIKEGKCNEVDIMLYKHSALVHLLVTVRDLLLACGLDAAVGYMTRAKETYTSSLGAYLNDVWKRLRIVQYFSQSTEEINPKITELQKQMSKWMQRSISQEHDFKVLVIIRMDSDCVRECLVNSLRQFTTLAATAILPEDSKTLDYNTVICCLQRHSCAVVCSQHLCANFPWNYFSLVVEYDYLEPSGWTHHCKDKDISHIAFKTVLPDVVSNNIRSQGLPNETFKWNSSVLLMELEVPFVFLATEGLIRSSQLLQNLESRYNITILERSCPVSVQLFEGMLCDAVITVDESTAVVVQEIEQLTEEKAADCFILRMLALSLQYTCCWIILSVTDTSRYTFTGKVFCNLVLIYAALVLLGLKSEDLEIKVLISSNTAETAQLIHQIGSFTLMSSKTDPLIWLDRSWLSVVASEAEQCLLSFPCINSFAAQLMLKRTPSLDWLFAATHSELQEVLPEIPNKAIKLFTSTTALYKLNASHSPTPQESQEISGDFKESCSHCTAEKTFPTTLDVSAQQSLEDEMCSSQYRLELNQKCDNCFSENQQIENLGISNYTKNEWRQKRISVAPLQSSNMVTQNVSSSSVPNKDTCNWNQFVHPSPEKEYSKFTCCNQSSIFTKELQNSQGTNSQASVLPLKRPLTYKSHTAQSAVDFSVGGNVVYRLPSKSSPTQRDNSEFGYDKPNSWNFSNLSPDCSRLHENITEIRKGMFNGSESAGQLLFSPHQKRKRLTYEKIPGRSDGQTRLAFF
ncbi:protein shortage in chiasmata 1 ortholog isoform X2 [Erpetoichthys calabaricus]|nr:protein shortage in chiasmata 1 ortholog isoform X2 [Erpetoichthys calabaricus]